MRECCTSGSVRGEGGNILTYSALRAAATRMSEAGRYGHNRRHIAIWVDPAGYRSYLASEEAKFEALVAK
jgi:hypothetical protein